MNYIADLNKVDIWQYSDKGTHRPYNEDESLVIYELPFQLQNTNYSAKLVAIFDGHGGNQCSKYLRANFKAFLVEALAEYDDLRTAIDQSCTNINKEFLDTYPNTYAGSTGIIGIILQDQEKKSIDFITANIGDSRGIMAIAMDPDHLDTVVVSKDHKPSSRKEQEYITSHNGVVIDGRLNGSLAVSRAFGDRDLIDKGLRCIPEFIEYPVDNAIKFVIYASDGLWDVVDNQEAVTFVSQRISEETVAQQLCEYGLSKGSSDNITVIIINFSSAFDKV